MPLTENTAAQDVRYHLYQLAGVPGWTLEAHWSARGTNTANPSLAFTLQGADPFELLQRAFLTVPMWRGTTGH